MSTVAASITTDAHEDKCPSLLRGVFNYLAIDWRARTNPGEITLRPRSAGLSSELVEYLVAGKRIALAQRRRNSGRAWDPKNLWLEGANWRAYQEAERHRCEVCVIAKNRAEKC